MSQVAGGAIFLARLGIAAIIYKMRKLAALLSVLLLFAGSNNQNGDTSSWKTPLCR
jgi:hypothetical protein